MAVLQITIPDELKTQFEPAFSGQDIDRIVSHLMSNSVEQARASQHEQQSQAIEELLALRQQTPPVSSDKTQSVREWVRP